MVQSSKSPRRWLRRFLWIALAVILLLVILVFGISGYAASSITKAQRFPVTQSPADFGLDYRDISFKSTDNLTLRGWWLGSGNSDRVIIMLHGVSMNRAWSSIKLLDIARDLVRHGYNVVMFDLRGHGESEGERISGGYYEKNDLLGAVAWVKQQGSYKIGVLGFSMGAATSLMAVPESKDILAVVSDSSYIDLKDIINYELTVHSGLPRFFFPIILWMNKIMYGTDFNAVKPVEAVKAADCPVFIISGGEDYVVTEKQSQSLYQASHNPLSRIWFVPDADHVGSYTSHPDEYIEKVTSFFDETIK